VESRQRQRQNLRSQIGQAGLAAGVSGWRPK